MLLLEEFDRERIGNPVWFSPQTPSCNGCKSFFRRTLLEKRKYCCERKGDCKILPKSEISCFLADDISFPTQSSWANNWGVNPNILPAHKEQKRHQCRACRFRLCVEAGMNPMGERVWLPPEGKKKGGLESTKMCQLGWKKELAE